MLNNNQYRNSNSDVISSSSFGFYGPKKIDPEMTTKDQDFTLVKPFQSSSYVDELSHQMELDEIPKI